MNSGNTINESADLWSMGKCVFCKGQIGEDSKILKCLHIICKDCIKKERNYSKTGVWCKCQVVTEGELINYSIGPLNESEVKVCCESDCNAIAKRICMYCKTLHCKPCSKLHLNKEKDHNPVLLKKYPLKREFLSCPTCIEKCIDVYCTECSKMNCALCHLTFHQTHKFIDVTTMADEIQTMFNADINEFRKKINHLDFLMQRLDDQLLKCESWKKIIYDKIDERMKLLHTEIDKRSSKLKQLFEMSLMESVNSITRKKEVLNDLKKKIEYYNSFTKSILECNKKFEYMKFSKIVSEQMCIAKSHILQIPDEIANNQGVLKNINEKSLSKCIEIIQEIGTYVLSPNVSSPVMNIAQNSNNTISRVTTHTNEKPYKSSETLPLLKSELKENDMAITDYDNLDYEPLVNCSCCNYWTEELIQCINCERCYHNNCHIPPLDKNLKPKDPSLAKWKCTICQDILIYIKEFHQKDITGHIAIGLPEKKIIERLLMGLYCQNEDSDHFREQLNREIYQSYYEKVKDPISFNDIKQRYESNEYTSFIDVLKDMKRVITNAENYYVLTHPYHESAKALHISLNNMMQMWIPTFDRRRLEQ